MSCSVLRMLTMRICNVKVFKKICEIVYKIMALYLKEKIGDLDEIDKVLEQYHGITVSSGWNFSSNL